jgi:hypothetical protein
MIDHFLPPASTYGTLSTIDTLLLDTTPDVALMKPVQVLPTHFELQVVELMVKVELAKPV